jgi:release factor glutamine methyltransferase
MRVETALRQGLELLRDGAIGAPALTAELLLAHTLHRDRIYLLTHPEYELSELEWLHYGRFLHERLKGQPTQYITRTQEFWGRDFHVEKGVLIPRPETEHVIEQALALLAPARATDASDNQRVDAANTGLSTTTRVLDIGTGSGILAVTLALEAKARVCATEISPDALRIARANSARLGAQVDFVQCDLGAAFDDASFDLIVSNPPYIASAEIDALQREVREWEPRAALDGGPDGFAVYRRLIPDAARLLRPGGWLILEIGATQGESVPGLLGPGWRACSVTPDLAGLPRVAKAQWSP